MLYNGGVKHQNQVVCIISWALSSLESVVPRFVVSALTGNWL